MQKRFRSKGIIFGILLMSKRKWHVKQKKKITLVFFAYLTKCFAEMATIVITMSVKTWYSGVTPFLPFLACLYFLTARLTITPTIHTQPSILWPQWVQNTPCTLSISMILICIAIVYHHIVNSLTKYKLRIEQTACLCANTVGPTVDNVHICASFENFFKITTTVKRLLRRGVGGV